MRIILVFLSTVFILAFDHESLGQKKEIIKEQRDKKSPCVKPKNEVLPCK